ncbi:MAG: zf-HC2 domain-containing protein [Planctomycetes bacterium]|nr:zf-HC2 domain-containing protein [Planctomycetota bacterium]
MTESCEETRARLEAWIDQALPEAEQRRLQEHLSGCAKCRSEEAELRGLATALGDLRLEPESPRMWARIRTAVLSEHCQANRIVPWVLAGTLLVARAAEWAVGFETALLLKPIECAVVLLLLARMKENIFSFAPEMPEAAFSISKTSTPG